MSAERLRAKYESLVGAKLSDEAARALLGVDAEYDAFLDAMRFQHLDVAAPAATSRVDVRSVIERAEAVRDELRRAVASGELAAPEDDGGTGRAGDSSGRSRASARQERKDG